MPTLFAISGKLGIAFCLTLNCNDIDCDWPRVMVAKAKCGLVGVSEWVAQEMRLRIVVVILKL